MSRRPKLLRVVANPFVAVDHEGRPAAAVGCDPLYHTPDRRHVGARHAAELLVSRNPVDAVKVSGDDRLPIHDIWFEFDHEVQVVPDSHHYRRQLDPSKGGQPAILPADKATADKIGLPFVDPSHVIVETARVVIACHLADHGELPDWAHLHPNLLPEGVEPSMEADDIHASHASHAAFLAKHVAKMPKPPAPNDEDKPRAPVPELAPVPRSVPAPHAPEHEEHV